MSPPCLDDFAAERQSHGAPRLMALLAVFAALGFGLEWLFWWATTGFRQRLIAAGVGTVRERVRAIGMRAAYGLGVLLAFAVAASGHSCCSNGRRCSSRS